MPNERWTGRDAVIDFNVEGATSKLAYSTGEGEHGGGTYTVNVELLDHDGNAIPLTTRQGRNSLADHYLLVQGREWKTVELLDIRPGDSVFGLLAQATWID